MHVYIIEIFNKFINRVLKSIYHKLNSCRINSSTTTNPGLLLLPLLHFAAYRLSVIEISSSSILTAWHPCRPAMARSEGTLTAVLKWSLGVVLVEVEIVLVGVVGGEVSLSPPLVLVEVQVLLIKLLLLLFVEEALVLLLALGASASQRLRVTIHLQIIRHISVCYIYI